MALRTPSTTHRRPDDRAPTGEPATRPRATLPRRPVPEPLPTEPLGLHDRLALLANALRWSTVGLGLLVGLLRDPADPAFLAGAAALVAHALLLSLRPTSLEAPDRALLLTVVVELVLTVTVTALTGGLDSPFALTPAVPMVLAGYSLGARQVVGLAAAGAVTTVAVVVTRQADVDAQRSAALLGVVFLLCGVLGAFSRRLVAEVAARQAATLGQMSRLATANELLVALHALAQTLPASLDLGEVVDSARARLRALFEPTALTVLVRDDATGAWDVALADGVHASALRADDELPPAMRSAGANQGPEIVADHRASGTHGCSRSARSGLYAPLLSRGNLVGLLAVEHDEPRRFGPAETELLATLTGPLALAVDNARWFARLRRFGAEAERARIARDLHDRHAQSLAYVAFELERLSAGEHEAELHDLRDVVRGLVGDLRETLHELRAGVSDEHDLVGVATGYLDRFADRTGLTVEWSHAASTRLPVPVEQELWRILQEALTNVERHAGASRVRVSWEADGARSRLTVADDGRGFEPKAVGADRYGLLGMRERADAIGARLGVRSATGQGTTIVVVLEAAR